MKHVRPFRILCCLLSFIILLTIPAAGQVWIDQTGQSIFPSRFMPAKGDVSVLVIPVEFSDFPFSTDPAPQLEEIFFSNNIDAFPSVSDYFMNASYCSLRISGTIQSVIALPSPRYLYEGNPAALIEELLAIITERGVDLSDYDANQDGILDGLYIVWAGPAQSPQSHWWPYSDTFYWDFTASGMQVGSFSSLSFEQLCETSSFRRYTAIHETGHQLGLTDYYADPYTSGTFASVMMDRNEGDEDCFSKMLLGWIQPQIIQTDQWLSLSSASVTSDAALIVPPGWDRNILSEYFMMEYITPEANQTDQNCGEEGSLRIWHVNAATSAWTDDITVSMYRYQNQGDGPKLLTIIEPDQQWYASGDRISPDKTCLYSGAETGLSFQIDTIEDGQARIWISYSGQEPEAEQSSVTSSGMSQESSMASPPKPSHSSVEEWISAESQTESSEETLSNAPALEPSSEGQDSPPSNSISNWIPFFLGSGGTVCGFFLLHHFFQKKHNKKKNRK